MKNVVLFIFCLIMIIGGVMSFPIVKKGEDPTGIFMFMLMTGPVLGTVGILSLLG